MRLDRREFLKQGVTYIGVGALMPSVLQRALAALGQQSVRGAPVDDGRVLVVVQMAGGNDGLNTVVPVTDSRYYGLRREISIPPEQALPLDSKLALHPSMNKMKELWDQEVLAIVEGVGYPNPNFSHFVSMDIWQRADPTLKQTRGWLGRYLEKGMTTPQAPFLGLAVGGSLPTAFQTPLITVPSVESLNNYQFQGDSRAPSLSSGRSKALMSLYEAGKKSSTYGPLLDGAIRSASASVETLQSAHRQYKPAVEYPKSPLASALLLVAEAIASNTGVKVCHVSMGGFDTHANQLTDQGRQLRTLSDALYAFYSDLKAHDLDSKVAVMTWSEFGRRANANASGGTDHGTAGPLFFLGTPVRGGFYGQRPDLGNLDSGNLRFTVDFRSVYATALGGWLGNPAQDVLGGTFQPMPLWR